MTLVLLVLIIVPPAQRQLVLPVKPDMFYTIVNA